MTYPRMRDLDQTLPRREVFGLSDRVGSFDFEGRVDGWDNTGCLSLGDCHACRGVIVESKGGLVLSVKE